MDAKDAVISSLPVAQSSGAVNLSLVKMNTITQTVLGVVVSGIVVAATAITVTLIAVRAGYDPPIARPDFGVNYKTIPFNLYPLLNDYNPRGRNMTLTKITTPHHGTAAIIDGYYVRYQSFKYWAGVDYINYTCANSKLSASSLITILIEDHAPTPIIQSYVLPKNSVNNALHIFQYENAAGEKVHDVDGDIMALYNCTNPHHGTITYDTRTVYYTPDHNFNGNDTITYCVTDFNLTSCSVINLELMNMAPIAREDFYNVPKNEISILNDMSNDDDPDGDKIWIVSVGACAYGSASVFESGQFIRYVPYIQSEPYGDSYEYSITDGELFGYSIAIINVVDVPPVAGIQNYTIVKNTYNNLLPFSYSDPDILDTLTVTISQPPSLGTYTLNYTSSDILVPFNSDFYPKVVNRYYLYYTPQHGGVYRDVIHYVVSDGYLTATGIININVINEPPIARPAYFLCHKNLNVVGNVIANDTDPDGDSVMLNNAPGQQTKNIPTTQGGYYNYYSNYSIQYFPMHNFIGYDTGNYFVTDIEENPADDLVTKGDILFLVIDDPPTPLPDHYIVGKGLSIFMNVMANDSDPNGDPISLVSAGSPPSKAKCEITTEDGVSGILYHSLNQVYTETWIYTIQDNDNMTNSTTVTVEVVDLPPVAVPDTGSVLWNQSTIIDVCANDTDPNPGDQAILTAILISTSSRYGGTLQVVNGRAVQYTAPLGWVGLDTFEYYAYDQILQSVLPTTVSVTVYDDPPNANPVRVSVHWSDTLSLNLLTVHGNNDPDGDIIFVSSIGKAGHGSVSLQGSEVTYQGLDFFVGSDSFTYTLSDWLLQSSNTVYVTLTNTPPVAKPVTIRMFLSDKTTTGYVHNVDSDPDHDPIYVYSIDTPSTFYGTLNITQDKRNVEYTPGNWTGIQYANYTITDGPSFATGLLIIIVMEPSYAINFTNINYAVSVHWSNCIDFGVVIDVDQNATDLNPNGKLTFAVVPGSGPADGTVSSLSTNGRFLYRCYNGTGVTIDSFLFTTSSGNQSITKSVTINVTDNAPIARNDVYQQHWSFNTFLADVMANDTDPDGDPIYMDASSVSSSTSLGASLTVSGNGIQYSLPSSSVTAQMLDVPDTFSYDITDTVLVSNTAQVTVTLRDTPPTAYPYYGSILWWQNISFVLDKQYCSDTDTKDEAVVKSVNSPVSGSLEAVSGTASYVYIPSTAPPQSTSYSIPYVMRFYCTDGLLTRSSTITITVSNTAPSVFDETASVNRDYRKPTYNFTGLLNATDSDGDTLTVNNLQLTSSSYDSHTFTSWSSTSTSFTITILDTFAGTKVLTWSVFDGQLYSPLATYTINFLNQPPTCQNYSVSTYKLIPIQFTQVPSGCSDPNFDPLTYNVTGSPAFGTMSSFDANNVVTFTPEMAMSGTFSVPYTATDVVGAFTTNYLTVTVFNRAPVAFPYSYYFNSSHSSGASYTISTYLKDSHSYDPDGEQIFIKSTYGGTCSTVGTISSSNNMITFSPLQEWNGTCDFNVVISDDDNHPLTNTSVITIYIYPPAPPQAHDDYITVNQNAGPIELKTSWMLANDTAPTGASIEFVGLVSCSSLGFGYCHSTPTYYPNSGMVLYNVDPNNCITDRFKYIIQTVGPNPMYSEATVHISFTNCYCKSMLDIYFIIDNSGSIGHANFKVLKQFALNITNMLAISPTEVNVGIVMFGFDGYLSLSLSDSRTTVVNTLSQLPYLGEDTNTKAGLYTAMADILGYFPNNKSDYIQYQGSLTKRYPNGRINVPKVFVILTDGISDEPCGCEQNSKGMYYAVYPGCQYMYNDYSSTIPKGCNSPFYPNVDCTSCNFYNFILEYYAAEGGNYKIDQSACMPCADPRAVTNDLNSWSVNTQYQNTSSPYPQFPTWKVIAMGIGPLVNNSFARSMIGGMTYDNQSQIISWNTLSSAVNSITSSACNTLQMDCSGNLFEIDFLATNPLNSGEVTLAAAKIIFNFTNNDAGDVLLNLFIENEIGMPGQPPGGTTVGILTGIGFDIPSGITVSRNTANSPYTYVFYPNEATLNGSPFMGKAFTFAYSSGSSLSGGGAGGLSPGQSVVETLTLTGTGLTANFASASFYQYYRSNTLFAGARFKSLENSASDKVAGTLSCPSYYKMFPN